MFGYYTLLYRLQVCSAGVCSQDTLSSPPPTAQPQVAKTAAVPKQQRKAPLAGFELGWTPENEVFVSRMAMLGFGSAVVGEYFTGNGILSQLSYEIGLQQVRRWCSSSVAVCDCAAL
jgi:hypothetical protein